MYRIGHSIDIHPLKRGRNLIIGGVKIPYKKGLFGHSDADVLYHAIAESILGALALKDLGSHFKDNDPKTLNMDSSIIVSKVYELMDNLGYKVNNLDAMILIEEPHMAKYIDQMRSNVANLLHTDINNVSIKPTRGEKLGFVGKKKGALASSTILLVKKDGTD